MKKKESGLSDESVRMVESLAELLDSHSKGKSLARHQAAAYRDVLRRIIKPYEPKYTRAERSEMLIAICYAIRKELAGSGRGNAQIAAADTAAAHRVRAGSVNTYSSRWKKYASHFIEMKLMGASRSDLSRTEFLARTLRSLES